ncbi:MAG: glycosyltransferase, partial [Actinobacteria bacterium]|nr:glycosyltransferase [Actinomycetota bacterium]
MVGEVSVLLPVLNERENLEFLVPELISSLRDVVDRFEVVVIDDSSDDGTAELMDGLRRTEPALRYISREGRPRSLPDSILDGVDAASFEFVAWMDADGSMR